METDGLMLLVKAILIKEDRKNLSAVKRKISNQEREVKRMRGMLKRQNATPPPKRYIRGSMKAKKLSRFIFDEIVVPDVPLE